MKKNKPVSSKDKEQDKWKVAPRVSRKSETSETLTVLRMLSDGFTQKQTSVALKVSKAQISKRTKWLTENGYLLETCRSNIKSYALTDQGEIAIKSKKFLNFSYTTRTASMRVHGIQLTIPVAVRKDLDIWGEWIKLKNQVQRIAYVKELDLTVREIVCDNGTCSIAVQTNSNIKFVDNAYMRSNIKEIVFDVFEYFLGLGYILDRKHYKVGNVHIWNGEPTSEKVATDYPDNLLLLGRKRAKFTPKDPDQDAKAWTDSTPMKGVESNDTTYIARYLKMPDTVHEILEHLKELKTSLDETKPKPPAGEPDICRQTTEEMIQSLVDFGEVFR